MFANCEAAEFILSAGTDYCYGSLRVDDVVCIFIIKSVYEYYVYCSAVASDWLHLCIPTWLVLMRSLE